MVKLIELVKDSPLTVGELHVLFVLREQGRMLSVSDMTAFFPDMSERWMQDKLIQMFNKGFVKRRTNKFYFPSKKGNRYINSFKLSVKLMVNESDFDI